MSDFGEFLIQGLGELQNANAGLLAMDAPPIETPAQSATQIEAPQAPQIEAPQQSFDEVVASYASQAPVQPMEMER